MPELREFIYLNDVSLNSHLSSLGRGVPSEIVQSSSDEIETTAEAGGTIFGIGASGGYGDLDRSAVETTLKITEPYRFQDLLSSFEEQEIPIHEDPDPRSLSRGDVVRISGKTKPMSLFKFEIAIKTVRRIFNSDFMTSLEELDQAPSGNDEMNVDQMAIVENLIETFIGDRIPLRTITDDWEFGFTLNRANMRVSPARAFHEGRNYTIIGRAEQRVLGNEEWDPVLATNIMNQYLGEESSVQEMRRTFEEVADEMNIPFEYEDWQLEGHSAIIQPIAMFW